MKNKQTIACFYNASTQTTAVALTRISIIFFLLLSASMCFGQQKNGADITWTTYEAENMHTTGTVIGPGYQPYQVETEASGQKCVKLSTRGQFVEFSSSVKANSIVIRFSLPDSKDGNGTNAKLGLYKNGSLVQHIGISSHYAYLYGAYPFTNKPEAGQTRHFFDEVRTTGFDIKKGDVIRIQFDNGEQDDAAYCIIDLADIENIPPPLQAASNSLSITDKVFLGADFTDDYTEPLRKCITAAAQAGKTVWIPAGNFKITGDIILPSNISIQGAGMWYTVLTGDEAQYSNESKRVRLKGNGSNIHLADFAINGKLNYRNDNEPNDGIVGSYGTNSFISRIWIEHTKVGMWLENSSNLKIYGCRLRNTIADGINFCVGMVQSTIENCSARGTGDDCFAIWPAAFIAQQYSPGHNLISHCTGQLPFLANGAAIYGGESNQIKNCFFSDISQGSAILVSTTFPTGNKDKGVDNNFSGTTVIEDCDITTSGGFDHEWNWRAAVEICVDKLNISGIKLANLNITNSLSNGVSVITGKKPDVVLANATLQNINITTFGLGTGASYGLYIAANANGSLVVKKSNIPSTVNESANFKLLGQYKKSL